MLFELLDLPQCLGLSEVVCADSVCVCLCVCVCVEGIDGIGSCAADGMTMTMSLISITRDLSLQLSVVQLQQKPFFTPLAPSQLYIIAE